MRRFLPLMWAGFLVLAAALGSSWAWAQDDVDPRPSAEAPAGPVAGDGITSQGNPAAGNPAAGNPAAEPDQAAMDRLNLWTLLEAGGTIGWVIMALSVTLVALLVEHLISVRRGALMPGQLAEEVHRLISQQNFKQAEQQCKLQPSFLGYVLGAGLAEVALGYTAVEKAMEDASQQQAARLFRKLEYFTAIGTIAPMLGLLGTVWGMILAFMEFEVKANPSVAELAPGIYRALVTTLQGLCVAIPSLAAYAFLRNRVEELVAQSTLMAEHVFSNYKRVSARRRIQARREKPLPAQTRAAPPVQPTSGAERAAGGSAE